MTSSIVQAFRRFLPVEWEPREDQLRVLTELVRFANDNNFRISRSYEDTFIEAVNQKLALNSGVYKNILDTAFYDGIKLNHFQKITIRELLDKCDRKGFERFLKANKIASEKMASAFRPVERAETLEAFNSLALVERRYADICSAIFSRFCFALFPETCTYSFFSENSSNSGDYFEFIKAQYPDMVDRSHALYIVDVSERLFEKGYEHGCDLVLNAVREAFQALNNHCDLAVFIPSININGVDMQWQLYADAVLFAEKHKKEKIDKAYFRWQKIGKATLGYIHGLTAFNAEFEFAFQGFVYKDCFVLGREDSSYSLLIILEKNVRDERVVNCPACRSKNVQGNSYPILNVKSWECENPLCPDRSKYDRGKRYSFMSLFRQKEMLNDDNLIPESSISQWRLDCRHVATKRAAFDMLLRHYSCVGDTVTVISGHTGESSRFQRRLVYEPFKEPPVDLLSNFKNSSYFYRYLQYNDREIKPTQRWTHGKAAVILGDSLDALRSFPDRSFSCAVTSPPYYNAKSYSQWANIYCYLYDMFNINREVFRVLKDGGVYLYNIFDYFDNENNIVLSAMGNKRMILGAYMIDMFRRIGFTVCGNIVWNKGEVQGNRSFNQGNLTPYYQAPLNCWEHILILSKSAPDEKYRSLFSRIEDIKPVIKMVRGKNVLGHDAPFPQSIPELLIRCMDRDDSVLDPFLGSGTTCIAANRKNVASIGIEKSELYFKLCQRLISEDLPAEASC